MSITHNKSNSEKNTSVFILDDEYLHIELVKSALKQPRWTIVGSCCDANEGLKRILTVSPEIVMLDLRFGPQFLLGFDLAKQMRQLDGKSNSSWPFIIFLTGYGTDSSRERAMEISGSVYLEKPLSKEGLQHGLLDAEKQMKIWRVELQAEEINVERIALIEKKYDFGLSDTDEHRLGEIQKKHSKLLKSISNLDTTRVDEALREVRDLNNQSDTL